MEIGRFEIDLINKIVVVLGKKFLGIVLTKDVTGVRTLSTDLKTMNTKI